MLLIYYYLLQLILQRSKIVKVKKINGIDVFVYNTHDIIFIYFYYLLVHAYALLKTIHPLKYKYIY